MVRALVRSGCLCLLAVTVGCAVADGYAEAACDSLDAGCDEREHLDGGDDDAGDMFFGNDPPEASAHLEPPECALLEQRVCGAGDPAECHEAPACAAALLLRRYEPEACPAALANEITYPTCQRGICAQLVEKVCGDVVANASCELASGCSPARELWRRATEGSAEERRDAELGCGVALEDEIIFAACP